LFTDEEQAILQSASILTLPTKTSVSATVKEGKTSHR